MLFRALAFTLVPTALELTLVVGALGRIFDARVAGAVALTFAAYVAWTVRYIGLSTAVRRDVNALDAATSGKAVDALLNYETVLRRRAMTAHSVRARPIAPWEAYAVPARVVCCATCRAVHSLFRQPAHRTRMPGDRV